MAGSMVTAFDPQVGDVPKPAMHPRLVQCYYALPDLEYIQLAIDNWFQHELLDTRSYIARAEMDDLFVRVNEMRADTIELAFLYAFLLAGAGSLNQVGKMDKKVLDALFSIKAARRFAGIIFELIVLDQQQQGHRRAMTANSSPRSDAGSSTAPLDKDDPAYQYQYDSLAHCPTALLHCRLHSELCIFFHQAKDDHRALTHGNHAIRFARMYGLFDQLRMAESEMAKSPDGRLPLNFAYSEQHIYVLRRIRFDMTVYPRLAINDSVGGKGNSRAAKVEPQECILTADEACQDPNTIAVNPEGKALPGLAFDFQCLKLILSEIRNTTHEQLKREKIFNSATDALLEAIDVSNAADLAVALRKRNQLRRQQAQARAERALANDDVVLALMDLLPSWAHADVRDDWLLRAYANAVDAGSLINMVWTRFACNQIRTENLMQTCDSHDMTPELQCRALATAQDTIKLLSQVRLLLRTPYSFASAREWLLSKAEWAVNVFNRIMDAEICRESESALSSVASEDDTGSPSFVTPATAPSEHSTMPTPVVSTPHTALINVSRDGSPETTSWSTPVTGQEHRQQGANIDQECQALTPTNSGELMTGTASRSSMEAGDLFTSVHLAAAAAAAVAASKESQQRSRDKTFKFFAWFIFGFDGIYATMQDLHCFGPSMFEASRLLKRMQGPPAPLSPRSQPKALGLTAEQERALLEAMRNTAQGFRTPSPLSITAPNGSRTPSPSSSTNSLVLEINKFGKAFHSPTTATFSPTSTTFAVPMQPPSQRRRFEEL